MIQYPQQQHNRGPVLQPTERRYRHYLLEAGALGAVLGFLLGRRHHPLVWAAILGTTVVLVATVALLWPELLAATALVLVARARSRGWSWERLGVMAGILAAGAILVGLGLAVGGPGGAVVAGVLAWAVWHLAVRERVRAL